MIRFLSIVEISLIAAAALVVASAAPVPAQPKNDRVSKPVKKVRPTNKAPAAKAANKCRAGEELFNGACAKDMIFTGDEFLGDVPTGYGDIMIARKPTFFGGLIRLRQDFHVEILKSADSI